MCVAASLPSSLRAQAASPTLASGASVTAEQSPKPTPPEIKVNRTLPASVVSNTGVGSQPAMARAGMPHFSADPQDEEFLTCSLFQEPLVPTAAKEQRGENVALAKALTAYATPAGDEKDLDAAQRLTPVKQFLTNYPHSHWALALWLDLGSTYRRAGYWTRALDAWEQAWIVGKSAEEPKARALADLAVAELAELNARLGRYERLAPLFAELDASHRTLHGSAADKLAGARQGLWMMDHQPDRAFRCGPMALNSLARALDPHSPVDPKVFNASSTRQGIALAQVAALSREIGKPMQMAFRTADKQGKGADFLTPAVVHWKAGHYAALVAQQDGRYRLADPTFGNTVTVSRAALEAETDGYFLVAANQALPAGWRAVTEAEGSQVWGKGVTNDRDPDDTSCDDVDCDDDGCPTCYAGPDAGDDGSGGGGYGGGGGDMVAAASSGANAHARAGSMVGMASYTIQAMLTSLSIGDIPLSYSPPRGAAVRFGLQYSQHEANQPAVFNYWNMGQKWTSAWLCYINDYNTAVTDQYGNTTYIYLAPPTVYLPGGGVEVFDQPGIELNTSAVEQGANPLFQYRNPQGSRGDVITQLDLTTFQRTLRNGTVEMYAQPAGALDVSPHPILITRRTDPHGNTTTFHYDAQKRLVAVQDALGQVTTLTYGLPSDPLKVTQVTDPFGRSCQLAYNAQGQLQDITDPTGIQSNFTYQAGSDFINSLTTPYGTSTFAFGDASTDPTLGTTAWVEATDPYGDTARAEYNQTQSATGLPYSEPAPAGIPTFDAYLYGRNTFYWDKKAYQAAKLSGGGFDYTKAKVFHFLHDIDTTVTSGTLESTKNPLESRVWRFYQGQNSAGFLNDGMSQQPSIVARLMDDGSTQLYQYQYNAQQMLTQAVDPLGRVMTYDYDPANGIDLLGVRNTTGGLNEQLASATYNSAHQPLTTTDAAGQTTVLTYNGFGQLASTQDSLGRTVNFQYDDQGYLQEVDGFDPSIKSTFTYDGFGRLASTTSYPDVYTVQVGYDAMGGNPLATLNRPATTTFPDGSYTEVDYTNLDVEWMRDRGGNWTHLLTNKLRQTVASINPLGSITQYGYCKCGQLVQIVDPNGNPTRWKLDAAERPIAKIYADGTETDYTYENTTSRLKIVTDAKGQTTSYQYNLDNSLANVAYAGSVQVTPGVTYGYDPQRGRLSSVVDGIGTTTYSYYPYGSGGPGTLGAGQVQSVSGPFANEVVSYQYDQLGRVTTRTVDGVDETYSYEPLGRLQTDTNALGTFTYGYDGTTSRPSSSAYPNGQQALYTYLEDNTQDRRLSQIKYLASGGGLLDEFDYAYDGPLGRIIHWGQRQPGPGAGAIATTTYDLGYDAIGQLTHAVLNGDSTSLGSSVWSYDPAGNRTGVQNGSGTVSTAVPTSTNSLFSLSGGGKVEVAGSLTKWANVTVNGQAASFNAATDTFQAFVSLPIGTQTLTINATDASGNTATNRYQLTISAGASESFGYDANGNTTAMGSAQSPTIYGWDAANRLVSITYAGTSNVTTFDYDGLSRRVRESLNGVEVRHWVWIGLSLAEERNAANAVTKRFFAQGEQIAGQNYFYTRDHLGTVRELVDGSQTVRARYSYDPYGVRSANLITSNPVEADFGFTGHYFHQTSGLHLALYRAYAENIGRWISRDPIGESGGVNLYDYVKNNPIICIDSLGLETAVVIFGPVGSSDFYGHSGMAFTGQGTYAFGGDSPSFGGNFTNYITGEAVNRDLNIYILQTTPEQEQAMMDYMNSRLKTNPDYSYSPLSPNTCASFVSGALQAAGIMDAQTMSNGPLSDAMNNLVNQGKATTAPLPKGSQYIPPFLQSYNKP